MLWNDELMFIPFFFIAASPNKSRSTMKDPWAFCPEEEPPPESIVYFIVLSGDVLVSPAFFIVDD